MGRVVKERLMETNDTKNSAYDLLPEAERDILLRMWPRYEDGALVDIADELDKGMVNEISFLSVGWYITCTNGTICEPYGTRVKRLAVLAADGEPLEVGQTVWTVDAGIKFEVHSIECDAVWGSLDGDRTDDGLDPKSLTHKRPVMDADGVPIHEGDTVYLLPGGYCGDYPLYYYKGGEEMVVKKLDPDHELKGVLKCASDGKCACFPLPCQLTHTKPEPPDTWERIEEDAKKNVCGYFDSNGRCSSCPQFFRGDCQKSMRVDLVKRCKKVVEMMPYDER